MIRTDSLEDDANRLLGALQELFIERPKKTLELASTVLARFHASSLMQALQTDTDVLEAWDEFRKDFPGAQDERDAVAEFVLGLDAMTTISMMASPRIPLPVEGPRGCLVLGEALCRARRFEACDIALRMGVERINTLTPPSIADELRSMWEWRRRKLTPRPKHLRPWRNLAPQQWDILEALLQPHFNWGQSMEEVADLAWKKEPSKHHRTLMAGLVKMEIVECLREQGEGTHRKANLYRLRWYPGSVQLDPDLD